MEIIEESFTELTIAEQFVEEEIILSVVETEPEIVELVEPEPIEIAEEIQTIVPNVDISILDILKIESSVSKRTSYGGTAPDNVLRAIKKAKQRFLKD